MQNLSQPSCTVTKAQTPRARIAATARRGELIELVVERKFGIDRLVAALGARQQLRQAMIALRPEHEIDRRRAADDLLALGLRDAAGDGDDEAAAFGRGRLFQAAHAAKLGIDFFRRLLADVAGVEDDEVGIIGGRRLDIALRRQRIRHAPRIVDVHLAAERFDEELAGFVHAGWPSLSLYSSS